MEERTEQKRVMADTYMEEVWEQQAVKNWSKPMHNFGVRQNAFNQSADQRIRALESENLQLRTQIRTLMQQTEELSQIAQRRKNGCGRKSSEIGRFSDGLQQCWIACGMIWIVCGFLPS